MVNIRLDEGNRRAVIINAAVRVGLTQGLALVNYDTVARECHVTTSRHTVKHWFRRDALWKAAIEADKTGRLAAEAEEMGWSA